MGVHKLKMLEKEIKLKEEIDKRYFNMSDEEKDILKKYKLFYYKQLPRYKISRALLIMKDEIERLEQIIIKIKKS